MDPLPVQAPPIQAVFVFEGNDEDFKPGGQMQVFRCFVGLRSECCKELKRNDIYLKLQHLPRTTVNAGCRSPNYCDKNRNLQR